METKNNNYNQEFKDFVNQLDLSAGKPTLFLHACCGPCLTYPLTILVKYFKVTVGYINPNIYPKEEYYHRLSELKRFAKTISKQIGEKISIVSLPYDYEIYLNAIKGHEKDLEGGERCTICHSLRLDLSFKYAYEHHFDYFTTVMSVSSRKPSVLLNQICLDLQEKYPLTKYIPADFKKEDGQLKGIKLAKTINLYRQNYCGCSFSRDAREEFDKSKTMAESAPKQTE